MNGSNCTQSKNQFSLVFSHVPPFSLIGTSPIDLTVWSLSGLYLAIHTVLSRIIAPCHHEKQDRPSSISSLHLIPVSLWERVVTLLTNTVVVDLTVVVGVAMSVSSQIAVHPILATV